VTGSCLTFTFFFLAIFNGELGLLPKQPGDYSFNVQDGPFERKHDLLEDISNATLGVSYGFLLRLPPLRIDSFQFQKMFVIGLPSRTDRRDSMSLAAAYTGLEIEYVDGVTDVENKTLPPGGLEGGPNAGSIRAWRAHMNLKVSMSLTCPQHSRAEPHIRSHPRGRRRLGSPDQVADERFCSSGQATRTTCDKHNRRVPGPDKSSAKRRSKLHRLQHRQSHHDGTRRLALRRPFSLGSPLARPLRQPLPTRQRHQRPSWPSRPRQRLHGPRATAPRHGIRRQRADPAIPRPHSSCLPYTNEHLLSRLRSFPTRGSPSALRTRCAQNVGTQ
jgi:hypothetical protein